MTRLFLRCERPGCGVLADVVTNGNGAAVIWCRGCGAQEPIPCRVAPSPKTRSRKSACVQGHEYTPQNTIRQADGARRCRTCHCAREQRRRLAKRAARAD